MSATKSEQEVLAMAYFWADNPTDRVAKRSLYNAVQADRKASEKNRMRNYHRAEKQKKAALLNGAREE